MKRGNIYLVPTALGSNQPGDFLPAVVHSVLGRVDHFVVEDEKSARRFLRSIGMKRPFEEISMRVLNEHSVQDQIYSLLEPALRGEDMCVMCDAGCPGVADPGSDLVRMAHENKVKVIPMPGPSSVLQALMASGLNGQSFAFNGYLPRQRKDRIRKLKQLEQLAISPGQSQLFMDTPYRNAHVLEDLLEQLKPGTSLCVACNINQPDEFIRTMSISEWKTQTPSLDKQPCIFIVGK